MMLSIVSTEFLLKNTIALTTSIITNINFIRSYKLYDDELNKIFIECDILSDIGIIKSYIDEHSKSQSPTFQVSLQNLLETLGYLEKEIQKLTTKIREHKQKWFNAYRSYDIVEEKKRIFVLMNQMNHRFDMLLKIK